MKSMRRNRLRHSTCREVDGPAPLPWNSPDLGLRAGPGKGPQEDLVLDCVGRENDVLHLSVPDWWVEARGQR